MAWREERVPERDALGAVIVASVVFGEAQHCIELPVKGAERGSGQRCAVRRGECACV